MYLKMIVLGIVLTATGCSMEPVVTQVGGAVSPRSFSGTATGEPAFALDVSRAGSVGPLETVTGNWHLQGFYTGSDRGCNDVSIHNLDLKRTTHYRVCGDDARERSEVAPTYPRGEDAERVRRSVMDAAWRNGQAAQQWEGYRVNSSRVGPPRADRCTTVSTVITYDGLLVRYDEERVCH